ncbi:four helix bundle protein [Enterovibrio norvegicus FF-33]|uniref:four helix bundle protein n=1 Tax=Enterovibrio norvegicus TaxID=188144 RepID=UPI0002E9F144|nr:four helix bundle protein [Enterovibrio norvegicus]OEE68089.1 four helix bundle protein [Enterovibrio norvegicus FF-33]OEE86170.1 four helix bundle protein [Enterovibrio norvegicus FF-162]
MRFKQLKVWQQACRLSCDIYKLMKECRDWGFRDQITRSGLSIPSNIAEGEERDSPKDQIRFLNIAKSSTAELITQIYIGIEVGYIDKTEGLRQINEAESIAGSLGKLIKTKKSRIGEDTPDYDNQ